MRPEISFTAENAPFTNVRGNLNFSQGRPKSYLPGGGCDISLRKYISSSICLYYDPDDELPHRCGGLWNSSAVVTWPGRFNCRCCKSLEQWLVIPWTIELRITHFGLLTPHSWLYGRLPRKPHVMPGVLVRQSHQSGRDSRRLQLAVSVWSAIAVSVGVDGHSGIHGCGRP